MVINVFNTVQYDSNFPVSSGGKGYSQVNILPLAEGGAQSGSSFLAPIIDGRYDYNLAAQTTSFSNVTIGTGNKVFVVENAVGYIAGEYVIAESASDSNNNMTGIVQSYNNMSRTLTIDVISSGINGSGSFSLWRIRSRSGSPGAVGAPTLSGNMTGNINVNGFSFVSSAATDIVLAPGSATDSVDLGGSLMKEPEFVNTTQKATSFTQSSSTWTIDDVLDEGNVQEMLLNTNVTTVQFATTPPSGQDQTLIFIIEQGAGAPYTITWPSGFKWNDGTPPTLSTTVGQKDIIMIKNVNGNTLTYGLTIGLNFS